MNLYDQVKVGDEVESIVNPTVYEVISKKKSEILGACVSLHSEKYGFYDCSQGHLDNSYKPHKKVESYELFAVLCEKDEIKFYTKKPKYEWFDFKRADIKDGKLILEV